MTAEAVLFIDQSSSYCGACGQMADPNEYRHHTIPPGPTSQPFKPGCGARFTHLSSHYTGQGIREAAQRMRPDLPWSPRMVEDATGERFSLE
jgi:hypothetical protein